MVAAWISADTGVGPSIASKSQDCNGTCADLPHAASSSSKPKINAVVSLTLGMPVLTSTKADDPKVAVRSYRSGRDTLRVEMTSAHVRAVLTQASLSLPVADGRCDLGTWQGVYLWEHRHEGSTRRLSVTVVASGGR